VPCVEFRFFTVNNFGVYFILFFIWGHTLVAMSFLISVFFQRERSASSTLFTPLFCAASSMTSADRRAWVSCEAFGYFYILGITFVAVFTIQTLINDVGEPGACVMIERQLMN
jgi:hypothetical protein